MFRMLPIRLVAAALIALAAAGLLIFVPHSGDSSPAAPSVRDPQAHLTTFASGLDPDDPYRDPSAAERETAARGMDLVLRGEDRLTEATGVFTRLGFSSTISKDPATGRSYAMFTNEAATQRSWGLLLVDLSAPARLAIEVPHPNSDLGTEQLGLDLFRQQPGSVLLVAGAHRKAGSTDADVAHNKQSLFHAMTTQFAQRDVPQLQLHGFAEESLPGTDLVVSAGSAHTTRLLRQTADTLDEAGYDACRAWTSRCGHLEGTTNVQSQEADRQGSPFVHLEISAKVRSDEDSRSRELVSALASVNSVSAK